MSFGEFEASVEAGQPIELYQFSIGFEVFRYTSSEERIEVASLTYLPRTVSRERIRSGPEDRDSILEITLPGDDPFAAKYISTVPGQRCRATVLRVQRADEPGGFEIQVLFSGIVRSVAYSEDLTVAKVAVAPEAAAADRQMPRYTYMGLCNHVLYHATTCKVDPEDPAFKLVGEVSAIDGATITVPGATAFGDGWFTGGWVEGGNGTDHRLILSHTGDDLQLLLPFSFDPTNTQVIVRAGCDHSIGTCDSKFFTDEETDSNVLNYGGHFYVPRKDIFSTGLD